MEIGIKLYLLNFMVTKKGGRELKRRLRKDERSGERKQE